MMRIFLFKAKLKSNGEWTEGNLQIRKTGFTIITPDETPLGKYGEVYPETVCQYVGFKDSNGQKIFENDLLVVTAENVDEDDGLGIVYYDEDSCMYKISFDGFEYSFDNFYSSDLEVKGNVFDKTGKGDDEQCD